jgi:hypothetical protein
MKRKFMCFLLTAALSLMLFPAAAAADYGGTENHGAQIAIDQWYSSGILEGSSGSSKPGDYITRGELAVILDRIMDYQTAAPNCYSDLGQALYTDSILKASAAGVIYGYGSMVRPTENATREEAAVMLGRALGIYESEHPVPFKDSSYISSWAAGMISAMAERGILHGSEGMFYPKNPVTHAEALTMIDNAVGALFCEAREYTGAFSGSVIVNRAGAVLKDLTVTGDLIIAQGVASGTVTLHHVNVTGNTIVRGGGADSIMLKGGCEIECLILQKKDDGMLRIQSEGDSVVSVLSITDGMSDITLTGSFGHVIIDAGVTVHAVEASVDILDITNSDAAFNIDTSSVITLLNIGADGASVNNGGSVDHINFNAEGIVFIGNQP